jgi:hypothetical protein
VDQRWRRRRKVEQCPPSPVFSAFACLALLSQPVPLSYPHPISGQIPIFFRTPINPLIRRSFNSLPFLGQKGLELSRSEMPLKNKDLKETFFVKFERLFHGQDDEIRPCLVVKIDLLKHYKI